MAFGLTNAPTKFQRLMYHAFREYLRQFFQVFLDDICVHSSWKEHLSCLQKVFERCRYYRIALNPHKCQFWVKQGVILGHIVSRNGITTNATSSPNKLQRSSTFHGPYWLLSLVHIVFVEIARPLYKLLIEFKWTSDCQTSYEKLKRALASAPILKQP